jgi:hypothetical protein
MRLVYAPRREGKTVAAVEATVRTNGFLLVATYMERNRILKDFRKVEHGVDTYIRPDQVITVNDLRTGRFRGTSHDSRVIIDNLELIIDTLVGMHVDVVTTSIEPETVLNARRLGPGAPEEDMERERPLAEKVVEVARALPVDSRLANQSLGKAIEKKRQELFPEDPPALANPERPQL